MIFTFKDFPFTWATFSIVCLTSSVFPSHINHERDSGTKPKKLANKIKGMGQMAIRIRARQLGKNIANAGTATEARVLETITINKGYVLVLIPQYSMAKMKQRLYPKGSTEAM